MRQIKQMKHVKGMALLLAALSVLLAAVPGCAPKPQPTAKVLKIGVVLPLTGDFKNYGISIKNAIMLGLQERNFKVGDYDIDYVFADDHNTPTQAANMASGLISSQKVDCIIGSVSSACSIPVSEVCEQSRVPLITPASSDPRVTVENGRRKQYAFRVCFIDPFQGAAAARFACGSLHARTAAIMYNKDSDYSSGLQGDFAAAFTKAGGRVLETEAYNEKDVKDADFSAALARIAGLKPDLLYLPDTYKEVSLIGQQARAKGIKATIMGAHDWDLSQLDPVALDGSYFTGFYAPDDPQAGPLAAAWVNKYQSKYGVKPDALATLGYEALQVALQAAANSGSNDPAKIRDAIQNLQGFQTPTAKIAFDQYGNVLQPLDIVQLKGGKQRLAATVPPVIATSMHQKFEATGLEGRSR
jgi:branched-chain amino acid transport system substrate-binding protein